MVSAMTDRPITLPSVERFIQERRRSLAFPPALEAQFENDTRVRRAKFLRTATLKTVIVYNLFLIGDWLLAPDVFPVAVALHVLVGTPWILFVAWSMRSSLPRFLRELAAASVPIVIVLQIVTLYCLTRSPFASHYPDFVLVTSIYANTIQRLRYAFAVFVSAALFAIMAVAIVSMRATPPALALMQSLTLAACIYLTLILNFAFDRDIRRSFLHALRDRLRLAEIDAVANRDALTGLANRRLLDARGAEIWQAGDELSSPVAAVLLDVDHFKPFNDLYGHPSGDSCLKRIGACVTAELRNVDDLVARYGGEEFLLLLPRTEISDAVRIAERVRRSIIALGIAHEGSDKSGVVTASFGVAAAPVSAVTLAELISAADIALYAAKRNGRNQVCPPLLRDRKPDGAEPSALTDARIKRSGASEAS
jgi:diguanylate cyclase (GGDEF)-like protein